MLKIVYIGKYNNSTLMAFSKLFTLLVLLTFSQIVSTKLVSGRLKTLDDWAFIARFCFLSGKGRYEYHIEFERRYGEPQLLLYYDDKTQWPAVYKTGKACLQKLSVLSAADNQIVTLSARSPFNMLSGCALRTSIRGNEFDNSKPTAHPSYSTRSADDLGGDINYTYYDQFLKTSTYSPMGEQEELELNFTSFNETDLFNTTENFYIPIDTDTGFENNIENNTKYSEYAEELFDMDGNETTKNRIKRSLLKRDRGTLIVTCNSAGGFLTARERWWYIAIANCGSKRGIDIRYKFRMTNGPPGDFWHEHFSADEMYIPPILMAESLVYTFLLLAVLICAIELKHRHLFHCTYRLFASSTFLQYLGVLFSGVAWTNYAITGFGPHNILGALTQGAAEIIFLTMLLLMAKGYTITRARLSTCSTVKLTVFINVYVVVYVSLFIYREEVFDPAEVLNLYESPAGFGLAGLRSASWGAFVMAIISTVRKFPEKASFYYPFGVLGSLWILGGPILTFTSIGLFDAWVRESVLCAVWAILAILGHASFLWLTWPSRANRSFPYHVRTNHVGVMSTDDDGADYPRHMYESRPQESNIIIPLSRRTEDLLNTVYSQYLNERDYYNSTSTTHSHVSFPESSAPPAEEVQQSEPFNQNGPKLPTGSSRQNSGERESQVDSGHQSFEISKSPKHSRSPSASIVGSPKSSAYSRSTDDSSANFKNNPFVINGLKNIPNKVILDPIRQPLNNSHDNVPKHLFAAKSSIEK